jgi:acetylornithine aminotransferase
LVEIVKEYPEKFEKVSGYGLMKALRAKNTAVRDEVVKKAFENRVLVLKAGEVSVRFLPPLTITKEEIDEGFDRLKGALN